MMAAQDNLEFDGGEKLKPFLFYKGNKFNKNLMEKVIDYAYSLDKSNVSNLESSFCLHEIENFDFSDQ